MKKLSFLISFVLIFIIGLTGCSSKIESLELVNKYFYNIKSSNFDENYDYLSSASKSIWTKENYKEWESISLEVSIYKDVKIEKTNEYKDKDLDGIQYKNIVEYNITEICHDNYHDKDANSNFVIYAVNENNQWKIYRGQEDPKEKIAKVKDNLAAMYFTGKGENKDINKAQDILNESIEENPDYSNSYYLLGVMYTNLQRYDVAIDTVQQNIDKAKSNEEKSNQYYILGFAYEGKKDYIKAKEYYTQSIEANTNNEVAKTALTKLNSESK